MKTDSSVRAQIAISLIPRLNSNFCLPLIEKCGGIEGFFLESDTALTAIYKEFNISPGAFNRKEAFQNAHRELEEIDKHGIDICSMESNIYPELLKQCEDAPLVFYYKGNLRAEPDTKFLAIVGTRHASARCQHWVETLLSDLCAMNCFPVIVSGLAYGIDASAHRGCLKSGLRTFAVLGHGLHMIYPAAHKNLAESILHANGALITEFPCTVNTHPSNFLKRNRIIAGLCHATLIAESAEKGGAMSTAKLSLSYNRDVLAFPGRSDDKYSAGCNLLIKDNVAALVDSATDIAHILHFPIKKISSPQMALKIFNQELPEQHILQLLEENDTLHIDELLRQSGIPSNELAALLLQLELEGKIFTLPGKRYAHSSAKH